MIALLLGLALGGTWDEAAATLDRLPAPEAHRELAESLRDLELPHLAAWHDEQALIHADRPDLALSLAALADHARSTGVERPLAELLDDLPEQNRPQAAAPTLFVLEADAALRKGDDRRAAQLAAQAGESPRALLIQGVAQHRIGQRKSSLLSFREARRLADVEDPDQAAVADLALMNIARIYFELERFDDADDHYAQIPAGGRQDIPIALERAWANFWSVDTATGTALLTSIPALSTPERNRTKLIRRGRSAEVIWPEIVPEADYLHLLFLFTACQYPDAYAAIQAFEGRYRPLGSAVHRFVDAHREPQTWPAAWDDWVADPAAGSHGGLVPWVLRHRELTATLHAVQDVERELTEVRRHADPALAEHLEQVGSEVRARHEQDAGHLLVQRLARWVASLDDLLFRYRVATIEVIDAQRLDLLYRAEHPGQEPDCAAPQATSPVPVQLGWSDPMLDPHEVLASRRR